LHSGLDGVKNQIEPPEATNVNIFKLSEEEKVSRGIESLPGNLKEALDLMKESDFMKNVLGEHTFNSFLKAKNAEWNDYKTIVHPWEIENYLSIL